MNSETRLEIRDSDDPIIVVTVLVQGVAVGHQGCGLVVATSESVVTLKKKKCSFTVRENYSQ